MGYAVAADLLALLHFGFILFVILGGFLALRWPVLAWIHAPALAWGAMIELTGWLTCPLTPWEVQLRQAAGATGYSGGFIDHYLLPLIYPPGLTRGLQFGLGLLLLVVNALAYGALLTRRRTGHGQT